MKQRLTRRGGWMLLVFTISSLVALLVGAGAVTAMGLAEPVRALPADELTPGEEFEVTVTFTSPHDAFHAIGLSDTAPDGWQVSVATAWANPIAMDAHTPQPDKAEYIWGGPYDAGTEVTVVYRVQVPADAGPGSYTFPGGELEYYVEGFPAASYIESIGGDDEVVVTAVDNDLPPVGGTASHVSRLALLAPWIVLGAAIITGAAIFIRRRQTQS